MFSANSRPSEAGERKPEQQPTGRLGPANVHTTFAHAPASLLHSKDKWEFGRIEVLEHCATVGQPDCDELAATTGQAA